MAKNFLTAEWQNLIMANYEIDPAVLIPYLPYQTELDIFEGKCYVSLVGFLFKNTKVLGLPIPWHRHFEEVNLRFYVRHCGADGEWKRGVVFIKEIVPKAAITWVANSLYGEHYQTMKMDHHFQVNALDQEVVYRWKFQGTWNHLMVKTAREALSIPADSAAEFITEHYWGYTRLNDQKTSEYEVVHPRWRMYTVEDFEVNCETEKIYGAAFAPYLQAPPASIFLADGSAVAVKAGRKI